MFVKSIIEDKSQDLITVSPTDSISDVAGLFTSKQIGFALVKDKSKTLIGTIFELDIIIGLVKKSDLTGALVAEVLTLNIVVCDIDDTLETVREIMTVKRTRHVLVMDGDVVAGIVSIGDLVKHSLNECRIDQTELVDYINGEGYH